ncbi:MAG TPA: pyridoxamine 5'-phosphate oxidase family protein [Streptosporangiaceae bacterium]
MELSAEQQAFLAGQHSAAMITVTAGGVAKVARVGVALVGGQLQSSGTLDRVRTRRLRSDPRCTLFVFDGSYRWLALESTVTILDGPDAGHLNVELFRVMQGRPEGPLLWYGNELDEQQFLATMADEGRLVYQFGIERCYGMT